MKNVVVFNVNWLGDVVFSSPVFKNLKIKYPDCRITCIAHPRVKDVVLSIPFIDEVLLFDERGMHRSLMAKILFIKKLKNYKFDASFILRKSFTRSLILWSAGIPLRYGYASKNWSWIMTKSISKLDGSLHRSDHYLKIIESADIEIRDRSNMLEVDRGTRNSIETALQNFGWNGKDKLIGINCGGNWDKKRWPPQNFSELIGNLMEISNIQVVITGSEKDQQLINNIIAPLNKKPIIMAGHTDIKGLIALCSLLDILVSNDSGPIHIANAAGTAVVGIFGPTKTQFTGPRGTGKKIILRHDIECNSNVCYAEGCRDNLCMKEVSVKEVIEAVKILLIENG